VLLVCLPYLLSQHTWPLTLLSGCSLPRSVSHPISFLSPFSSLPALLFDFPLLALGVSALFSLESTSPAEIMIGMMALYDNVLLY
jgi:hypothetical protein